MNNISGPVNFYKLKNNDKIIYLFFDLKIAKIYEKKCNNETHVIDDFLEKFFEKNNTIVDFFFEISDKSVEEQKGEIVYLQKINNLFTKIYNKNKKYENLRIHYIDVRKNNTLESLYNNVYNLLNYDRNNNTIESLITDLKNTKNIYTEILNDIDDIKKGNNFYDNEINRIFYKIINKYNDLNNKKLINDFFDEYVVKKINGLITVISETLDVSEKIKNGKILELKIINLANNVKTVSYMNEYDDDYNTIIKNIKIIDLLDRDIQSNIMDSYFLRRFIDKNYIKNAILYSNLFHCSVYLWFLIKYCKFEIVESANNNNNNRMFKEIIDSKNFFDVYCDINIDIERNFNQCVKINNISF